MKRTCGLLIDDGTGRVLLQLRDDKPSIPFPNKWSTFGGQVEDGEEPLVAIKGEIKEELAMDIAKPELVGIYHYAEFDTYLYRLIDTTINPEKLTVLEGQKAGLFSKDEVLQLDFAFELQDQVLDYFSKYY